MKKTYIQPTMKVRELHPHAAILTTSQFPDKAGILDEEGNASDYFYSTRFLGVCRLLFQYNTSMSLS